MTLEQIQALTDDEIRVRVAELMGYRLLPSNNPKQLTWQMGGVTVTPPNYPAGLNACASFEATLTREQCQAYNRKLMETVTERPDTEPQSLRWSWGRPPRARCEAFLAVMQAGKGEGAHPSHQKPPTQNQP